jgi:hypothetical protein
MTRRFVMGRHPVSNRSPHQIASDRSAARGKNLSASEMDGFYPTGFAIGLFDGQGFTSYTA